jgi:hypothetical protein
MKRLLQRRLERTRKRDLGGGKEVVYIRFHDHAIAAV